MWHYNFHKKSFSNFWKDIPRFIISEGSNKNIEFILLYTCLLYACLTRETPVIIQNCTPKNLLILLSRGCSQKYVDIMQISQICFTNRCLFLISLIPRVIKLEHFIHTNMSPLAEPKKLLIFLFFF